VILGDAIDKVENLIEATPDKMGDELQVAIDWGRKGLGIRDGIAGDEDSP
jgi:hypothetical protein